MMVLVTLGLAFGATTAIAQGKSLSKKEARDLIKSKHQAYRDCYTSAVTSPPGETVRVRATVSLDSQGALAHSEEIKGAFDAEVLGSCMSEVFASLPAAPVKGGTVSVSFPFLITK